MLFYEVSEEPSKSLCTALHVNSTFCLYKTRQSLHFPFSRSYLLTVFFCLYLTRCSRVFYKGKQPALERRETLHRVYDTLKSLKWNKRLNTDRKMSKKKKAKTKNRILLQKLRASVFFNMCLDSDNVNRAAIISLGGVQDGGRVIFRPAWKNFIVFGSYLASFSLWLGVWPFMYHLVRS